MNAQDAHPDLANKMPGAKPVEYRMQITVSEPYSKSLEHLRPVSKARWRLVASGYWAADMYHSGHVAYYLAKVAPNEWVMESVARNALLDSVTQEDVDEGRLNDDQIQAMWGTTLEEAQAAEYREIVAVCRGAPARAKPKDIAVTMYRDVCQAGRNAVGEPDRDDGLLEF